MFTGIVEETGTLVEMTGDDNGRRMVIRGPVVTEDAAIGDSIAVNGTCLTVVAVDGDCFTIDAVVETLDRTNLGRLRPGDAVNLERAMPIDGRFDGHIVQGHIDGVGTVVSSVVEGEGRRLTIRVPDVMNAWIVEKGSITMDGVSLTIASVDDDSVSIALIPHTLEMTTLGRLAEGDEVNLEGDILGKYVARLMELRS